MEKYILALDQGTTSSRAVLFDRNIGKVAVSQQEFTQIFPRPGWVEHDPEEIFSCQLAVMKDAMAKGGISGNQIEAIGITNQRETVILWDRITGKPVCNAIVWQCRRTADMAEKLISSGYSDFIRKKTGLVPDAYFSATKIRWILDNIPGVRERAEKGEILAGTVDTWLVWKLSGGKAHVTDYSNASRTMLFNIHTLEWDRELLELLDIPACILPEVRDSSGICAVTDREICGFEVPVASMIGDQQSALFGQACFSAGDVKCTYGTGCFLLMNTGDKPFSSAHRLLTTVAWSIGGKVEYALEGSVFVGGAVIKWLRDELGIISSARECDILAETVPDTDGVILVPAFTGLGAPYWNPKARGVITGLSRGTGKAHICRAALESIAFQVKDEIECMTEDTGIKPAVLKVDGGASAGNLLMQFQADLLDTEVRRPVNTETTVTGAAFLAGLATGFWKSAEEIKKQWQTDRVFVPEMERCKADSRYAEWKNTVGMML